MLPGSATPITALFFTGPTKEPLLGAHRGTGERQPFWRRRGGCHLWAGRDVAYAFGCRWGRRPDRLWRRVGLVSRWAGRFLWLGSIAARRGVWTGLPSLRRQRASGGGGRAQAALLGRPLNSRCCRNHFYPGPVFSPPHLSPRSMLFSLFEKVTKINLKVSFFVTWI